MGAWLTEIVRVMPPPEIVTVPVEVPLPLLAVAEIVIVPLLLPEVGDTEIHDRLEEAVQDVLDVIEAVVEPPGGGASQLERLTVRLTGFCVMLMVRVMLGETPELAIVTVPERVDPVVFWLTVTENVLFPEPLVRLTLIQVGLRVTDHEMLLETVAVCPPPFHAKVIEEGATERDG